MVRFGMGRGCLVRFGMVRVSMVRVSMVVAVDRVKTTTRPHGRVREHGERGPAQQNGRVREDSLRTPQQNVVGRAHSQRSPAPQNVVGREHSQRSPRQNVVGVEERTAQDRPERSGGLRLRVIAYAALLFVGATALIVNLDHTSKPPLTGGILVILLAFVGSIVTTMFPVHIEVGRDIHSFMLHELALVIAVLALPSRVAIAAVVAGATVTRIGFHRTQLVKAIVNIAVTAIEVSVVAKIFQLYAAGHRVTETPTWLAVLAGVCLANAASAILVSGAILLSGGRLSFRDIGRNIAVGMAGSVAMGIVAITGVVLTVVNVASVAFTIFMGAGLLVAYRRHVRITSRYQAMQRLERFTRALPPDRSIDVIADRLLQHAADLMNTEEAAITLVSSGSHIVFTRAVSCTGGLTEVRSPTPGDWVWIRALAQRQAFLLSRTAQRKELDIQSYLTKLDATDLIVAPLHLDEDIVGVLIGRNRRNSIVKMTTADLDLVTTMAHHASVTLERSRLIEKLEQEVSVREYQATHDSLTGLHNRAHFNATADAHLSAAAPGELTALMLVDLNHFKKINDTMGHHAGDDVLVQIAGRLIHALPPGSAVARLGGDEFAILVPNVSSNVEAVDAATSLREAINLPVTVDDVIFALDAAIGVSVAPEHGTDRHTLLKRADIAMYAAKDRRGGVPIAVFDPSQQRWTAREVALIEDLRNAIERNHLSIAYQPKVSLTTGAVTAVEALCRWNHPIQGAIRPDEFIGLAEQAGLIDSITEFMLTGALRQCRSWLDDGFEVGVAVNMPAQSLADPTLASRIARQAAEIGVEPRLLTIEVTESELMEDARSSRAVMSELRALGFQVSIDDFGTGYSSLAYLHTLPVDE